MSLVSWCKHRDILARIDALQTCVDDLKALQSGVCFHVSIWAEQNGNISANNWNYSWGNGNEQNGNGDPVDWGYVAHYDYEILSLSVGSRTTNTAATEVEITVNGATVGQSVTAAGSTTKAVNNGVVYAGVAGDTLNFRTLQAGGANDVVVSAIIRYCPDGTEA